MVKRLLPNKKYQYHLIDLRCKSKNYSLNSLININEFKKLSDDEFTVQNYLNHKFNLLGSGWVSRNKENNTVNVLEVHSPISDIIGGYISPNYRFINWQIDPLTNYEFDIKNSFNNQKAISGVDIKHPWELGRLQHLPQLAFFAINAENKDELIAEFKHQALDFISNNPIGMGVQWSCPMDVGIRVSNLLVAFDIFNQIDHSNILDEEFKSIFIDSIFLHGQFIFNHLEYKEGLTGNHYLFNLSGLLFVATYLTKTKTTNKWLEFVQPEIEKEFFKQFFNDGGNFEGSTTYHCLSSEMMVYSTALMLRNNYTFTPNFTKKLYNCSRLIYDLIKPNGEIPQFGDNDSGRYFKLSHCKNNSEENLLNYESLLSAFYSIFGEIDYESYSNNFPIESTIISQLSNSRHFNKYKTERIEKPYGPEPKDLQYSKVYDITFEEIDQLTNQLDFFTYSDFGISIFKTSKFYLAISHISNKKMHHSWGHVHNDKLSFELFVNGKEMFTDAGSYCYTSDVVMRNKFRSTQAHHTSIVNGVEQNKFLNSKNGLFYLDRESTCCIIEASNNSIKLMVRYYGIIHVRDFKIFDDKIVITDSCNAPFDQNFNTTLLSKGYGKPLF